MEKRKKSTGNRLLEHHVSKDAKRRKMKPITEKIRRERINNSLDELKLLILSALNEDVSHYAKMEKADILEMAVKYIKRLQNVKQGLQVQGECLQVTKADTATRIPSVTTATTTYCNESNTLNNPTEQQSLQTRPSTTGSLDLVLPAIPITIPDVAKETPAFSSSCGSFPITSTNVSCSLHEKEIDSFPFPKTYNDSKRSPFAAVKEQNALITSSYKDSIPNQSTGESIDYRPEKVRLPGMECFIRRNNNRTAVLNRETDKENAASFDDFVHRYNRGFPFDNPQFALTLWRPW